MKMMTAFRFSTIMMERVRPSEVMMRVNKRPKPRSKWYLSAEDEYVVVFEQPEELQHPLSSLPQDCEL